MSTHARYVFVALSHNQQSLENGRPDWSEWLACFFHILQTQKDDLHARLRAQDKDLSHVPGLSAQILRLFEAHQRLQMKQIIKLTNGRRSTIKLRIGELVEQGYLNRRGGGRSTWYSLN